MGNRAKALLTLEARPFLEIIAETARKGGASGVAVVIGHHGDEIRPLASSCCDRVARNSAPDRGMGSSARELARILPDDVAMLLWPVDMPLVTVSTIAAIITEAREATHQVVVVPVIEGADRQGHPPLLPPRVVEALRGIPNEARLDQFIEEVGGSPYFLPVDDDGVLKDVDSPSDLDGRARRPTPI